MDEFLDKSPLSTVTSDSYLWTEAQIQSYPLSRYTTLPSHTGPDTRNFGMFGFDENTDNMASMNYSNKYVPGQYLVGQSGGNWEFTGIYQCNYFLNTVLPRWKSGLITGNSNNIKHYIGEMYFFRAFEYFSKLQKFGDFPIIKTVLKDDSVVLTNASKRMPSSEVARFIIQDLDSAINLMLVSSPDGAKNRLSKGCAQILKSRVALYEATWLKYFKNTAFVPNGPNWPGASKDYNKNYQFQAGDIDSEINWLLEQSMSAASDVVDKYALVNNNGILKQTVNDATNPYYNMFCDIDMSSYSEVIMWRKYDAYGTVIKNSAGYNAATNNWGTGLTRGYVDNFLMSNGLPIYASGSGYYGDDSISLVRKERDGRLWLFLKEPGQVNILTPSDLVYIGLTEPKPVINNNTEAVIYTTGYSIRKGLNNSAVNCYQIGSIIFRSAEAYLNYIEACYERYGLLDDKAKSMWRSLRTRAKVNTSFETTIAATNLDEEAKNDWAVYSGGVKVDPTLYNIRRERRCELLAEGFRNMDIRRWRAMDQLITTPYQIEGFKLWGPMVKWYKDASGKLTITYGTSTSTVSSPTLSVYLRPYQKTGKELVYNGYKWAMAHYLEPIALQHFLITSIGKDVSQSPIYQNPGWPIGASLPPTGY
jgi:hypothetical protein